MPSELVTLTEVPHPTTEQEILNLIGSLQMRAVIMACHKTESIRETARQLGVSTDSILGADPEVLGDYRAREPLSEQPIEPVLFKILRLVDFISALKSDALRYDRIITVAMEILANSEEKMPREELEAAYEQLEAAAQTAIEDFVDGFVIMSSDIVLSINGEAVHKLDRRTHAIKAEDSFEEPIYDLTETKNELLTRHATPTIIEWRCAFGVRHDGRINIFQFDIAADLPAFPEDRKDDLVERYFHPKVSGGLKLVELMNELSSKPRFSIRNANSFDWYELPSEMAELIIAKKTLPREMWAAIQHDGKVSKHVEGEKMGYPGRTFDYDLLPFALAYLGTSLQ